MHKNLEKEGLYFDYAAATPVDPRVLSVMRQQMIEKSGSHYAPHHDFGRKVAERIEESREQVSRCIGAQPDEIVFTASASEANNIAILGLAEHLEKIGKTHIITHAIEHRSVLGPIEHLRQIGFRVTVIQARSEGILRFEDLERCLSDDTGLVSLQSVNNEIGTVQPLQQAASLLAEKDIILHTDAAQALDRTAFSVAKTNIDLATISSQKTYGPSGIAALYVRRGFRRCLNPILKDGGDGNLRPGALSAFLCAGFGSACGLAGFSEAENLRLENLRQIFLGKIRTAIPDIIINGTEQTGSRVPGIISLRIPSISSELLVKRLPDIAFGVSFSLSSQERKNYSHVLRSLTGNDIASKETIRISFGRFTEKKEMETLAFRITDRLTLERSKHDHP